MRVDMTVRRARTSNHEACSNNLDFGEPLGWRAFLRLEHNLALCGSGRGSRFDVARRSGMPGDGGRARGQLQDGLAQVIGHEWLYCQVKGVTEHALVGLEKARFRNHIAPNSLNLPKTY